MTAKGQIPEAGRLGEQLPDGLARIVLGRREASFSCALLLIGVTVLEDGRTTLFLGVV